MTRKNNMIVKVLSRASGHKQVKLHALLLNFINFINSLEEREKRRKRPQRGAESSGSVTLMQTIFPSQISAHYA